MNDFLILILDRLGDGILLAVMATLLCAVGIGAAYLLFKKKYKDTRKFPFAKTFLWLAFAGYIAIVLTATVLRGEGLRGSNFRLFRAWREAWNIFSFKNWANVLLNIAMFIPLGVLLPWIHNLFRKWYVMLGSGFACSFLIEIFQAITGRGLFDVDDLFANTLGAIFGYGLYMALRSVFVKSERKAVRISVYAAIPLVITLSISSIFVVYAAKDYGNLQNAAIYRVNTKGTEWETNVTLSEEKQIVSIYRAMTFNKKTCDEFGKAFLGGRTTRELDICYYDQETHYLDHSEHSLIVSHLDRSYRYRYQPSEGQRVPAQADRATVEALLFEYGIVIPERAAFTYESDGWHRFDVPMESKEGNTVSGTLRCRYSSEGFIYVINNNLVSLAYCADEQIISESEAFERMKRGSFLGGVYEMLSPENVTVLSCELEYQVDTKGFYQPVYLFKVMYDGVEDEMGIMIPALDSIIRIGGFCGKYK